MRKTLDAALLAALVATGAPLAAQAAYPDKPITVIVGFAPGGPTDALGRVIFKKVSEELGVSMIIENKPGAGGNIAAQYLAQARPDGYTLMFASAAVAIAPALYKREDLNPKRIFSAVGCSSKVPFILLAAKKTPADDAQELFKQIRQHPGKYFLGTSGNGTMDQVVAANIATRLGQEFEQVPYKGNGPALTALVAGDTQFMYSGSFNSALPYIKDGQIKALAVTSSERSPALPDVPALKEAVPGLGNFDAGTWQAVVAPHGTPADILARVNQALNKALKDPEVMASLRFQGAEAMDTTPAQCQDFVASEYDRWSETVQTLGLKE